MRSTIVGTPWFDLARHEEPEPEPTVTVDPVEEPVEQPAKKSGGNGFPENTPIAEMTDAEQAAYYKFQSRKHETRFTKLGIKDPGEIADLRAAAKELAALKAGQLSEAEKLAAAKDAAEKRAEIAVERAVRAEVRALASDAFADPSDAVDALRAAEYVNSEGEVDLDAIKAKLADLLDAKPHWKKAPPAAPAAPKPRPDPGQGARTPAGPIDFKTATREEYLAEAARVGFRPR